MTEDMDQAKLIADRIARRVGGKLPSSANAATELSAELAAMRESLSELQNKLMQMEMRVNSERLIPTAGSSNPAVPRTHSPWLAGVNEISLHPSEERFGVEEATVAELVDFFQKEKACSMEPGGKPCDHCAMCSGRGF